MQEDTKSDDDAFIAPFQLLLCERIRNVYNTHTRKKLPFRSEIN